MPGVEALAAAGQGSREDVLLGFPPLFYGAFDLVWESPAMRVMHHDLPAPVRRSAGHCAERGLHMLASPASDAAELDVDCFDEVAATQWESICHGWQQHGKSMARAWQDHGKGMARA